jgi:gliding motility associated protien GldN
MKKILVILFAVCIAQAAVAQPPARRAQQQQQQQKQQTKTALTPRAQLTFPTEQSMSEDVVWRRDVYRELNLNDEANAALYYPVEPLGQQMNLFTYLFKLVMTGNVPAYEYRLDGNELFTDSTRVKPLALLDNYHIFYERTDRGVRIDDSDIPSREVTAYYIKESSYFDQRSATFHTRVLALCPILKRQDDFGDAETSYPLFWVNYNDLAPFLTRQTVMTSNLNNASTMSLEDYFDEHLYNGKIYKTNNLLGKTLAQYCKTDSALTKEQKKIEGEIAAFEKHIWGDQTRKDSLDSIAKLDKKTLKKSATKANRRDRSSVKAAKSSRRSSSGSSAARVTVRRERH